MCTNIEKSFYTLGRTLKTCFNCSYCRAIEGSCKQVEYDILPTDINPIFKDIPVAINLTYGDPLLQVDKTVEYLHRLEEARHKGIVVIITKGDFSQFPDIPFNLDLHIAFSTFGKNHKYDGGSWERFISNLEQTKNRKYNYKYSIEFSPICCGINDDIETIARVMKTAKKYNMCISYSGLQGKPEVVEYWEENNIALKPYEGYEFGHKKPISEEVERIIREEANKNSVILFHKTSCMLSYIHNKDRDYNCHYYRPDEVECSKCPMNEKCRKAKHMYREVELPFDYRMKYEAQYECMLYKTGKCNYPSENCKRIEGIVIETDVPLRISDYRLIKWLTGYSVNSDFEYNQEISDIWRTKDV